MMICRTVEGTSKYKKIHLKLFLLGFFQHPKGERCNIRNMASQRFHIDLSQHQLAQSGERADDLVYGFLSCGVQTKQLHGLTELGVTE